ncbi:tyrosine-type recombinase/integrase [Natrialbaceae archaeon A-CW1-1]
MTTDEWTPGDKREYSPLVEAYATEQAPKRMSQGTVAGNKSDIQQFLDWYASEDGDLENIDDRTLKAYIGWIKRDYPQNTALKKVNSLSNFFDFLVDIEGVLEENPRESLQISDYLDRNYTVKQDELTQREGVVWLQPSEFQTILENVPQPRQRNELLLRLAWQTGLRASEIVSIRHMDDIHRDERRIEIKSAKQGSIGIRDVWWKPSLDPLLNRYLDVDRKALKYSEESPYLFCSSHHPYLSSNRPNHVFKKAVEAAGLQETIREDASGHERKKYTFHCLRHSFAVHFVKDHGDGGGDIRSLQKLMGHSSIEVTEKYLQFADETLRQKQMRHGPD